MTFDSNTLVSQIHEDMDVYCSDGDKIGTVGTVHIGTTQGDVTGNTTSDERSYVQVTRGGIFGIGGDDLWVPADEVQEVSDDRVTLKCTGGDVTAYSSLPIAPQPGGGNRDNSTEDAGALGVAGLGVTTDTPNTPGGTGYGPRV